MVGLALLLAATLTAERAPPAHHPDAGTRPCPAEGAQGPHCVYLTLRRPSLEAAQRVSGRLKADGVEAEILADHGLVTSLTDAQLRRLLGARVRYTRTGRSAGPGLVCSASIDRIAPPERHHEIASARIDPACP